MPRAIVDIALAIALTITLATPLVGQAQTAAKPTLEERLARAAAENAVRLGFDGRTFSGPGWDRLVSEGRAAQAFLLGEEHGIAENPKLAAALFEALVPAGYARFVIEVSWPMADALDGAARQGVAGLRRQFAEPGGEPAFFGMKEEAEMLVAVRAAVPGDVPVFWGVDYEVGGDRLLLSRLADRAVPASASAPLARLRDAASAAWAEYAASGDISKAFSFAGDPALVVAVRDAWPAPDAETHRVLDALEQTLQINRLWVERRRYDSNRRRADFLRANFRAHWQSAASAGPVPRVFAKLGASHLVRGLNPNEVFDIGTLAPELAEAAGGRTFHLMVLPGSGARGRIHPHRPAAAAPAARLLEPRHGPGADAHRSRLRHAAGDDRLLCLVQPAGRRTLSGTRRRRLGVGAARPQRGPAGAHRHPGRRRRLRLE